MKFVQFVFWWKSWCFQVYIVEVIDLVNKLQLMVYIYIYIAIQILRVALIPRACD